MCLRTAQDSFTFQKYIVFQSPASPLSVVLTLSNKHVFPLATSASPLSVLAQCGQRWSRSSRAKHWRPPRLTSKSSNPNQFRHVSLRICHTLKPFFYNVLQSFTRVLHSWVHVTLFDDRGITNSSKTKFYNMFDFRKVDWLNWLFNTHFPFSFPSGWWHLDVDSFSWSCGVLCCPYTMEEKMDNTKTAC